MLLVRDAQRKALTGPIVERYLDAVVPYLEATFEDLCLVRGRAGVEALVRGAVDRAARYALTRSHDVTVLASLMLVYGEDMLDRRENAWMLDILESRTLAREAKMQMIAEQKATAP